MSQAAHHSPLHSDYISNSVEPSKKPNNYVLVLFVLSKEAKGPRITTGDYTECGIIGKRNKNELDSYIHEKPSYYYNKFIATRTYKESHEDETNYKITGLTSNQRHAHIRSPNHYAKQQSPL